MNTTNVADLFAEPKTAYRPLRSEPVNKQHAPTHRPTYRPASPTPPTPPAAPRPEAVFVSHTEKPIAKPAVSISCTDVAKHCANCPVCSSLYNHDVTPYVMTIVILSLICIMMAKKSMEL